MTATEQYCQMCVKWTDAIPAKLATEDPGVLSRFLTLTNCEAGISRSELEQGLGFLQPRVNKLAMKLLDKDWLEIVKKRRGKATVEFLRMTPLAISAMKKLEASLRALSPPPKVTRASRPKGGGLRRPANVLAACSMRCPHIPRRMMPQRASPFSWM